MFSNPGSVQVVGIDPGVTTGICVVDLDPRWVNGYDTADWSGLGRAIQLVHHQQIGRHPRSWDFANDRAYKSDTVPPIPMRPAEALRRAKEKPTKKSERGADTSPGTLGEILDGTGVFGGGELMHLSPGEILQTLQVQDLLEAWPDAAIVLEDFIIRKINQTREFLAPVRVGNMIIFSELVNGSRARTPFMQSSSVALSTATDERLKLCGLYRPGFIHGNDAARHVATFLREARKDEETRCAAWPHIWRRENGE